MVTYHVSFVIFIIKYIKDAQPKPPEARSKDLAFFVLPINKGFVKIEVAQSVILSTLYLHIFDLNF